MSIMSIILDLIVVVLIGLNIYLGYKNGFVKTVLNTFSTAIALLLSYLFSPALSGLLADKFFAAPIRNTITDKISALLDAGTEKLSMSQLFEDAPAAFVNLLKGFGVDFVELEAKFESSIEAGSASLLEDVVEFIATPLINAVSTGVAFFAIFLVTILVLKLVCFLFDTFVKKGLLHNINAFLGLILGVVSGFLMAWGLSCVFAALLPALSSLFPDVISQTTFDSTILVKLLAALDIIPGL